MNTAEIQRKLTFDARPVSVWNGPADGDSIACLEGEDEDYEYRCQIVKTGGRSTMAVVVLDGAGWEWSKEWTFEINRAGRVNWSVNFKREPDAPPWRAVEMNWKLEKAAEAFMEIFPPYPQGPVLD